MTPSSADESAITDLYHALLNAWNRRSADDFAAQFDADGCVVGFDGSQMNGREAIAAELTRIFADHMTGTYVGKIREVRSLTPNVALLRAVSGVMPHGQHDLNPATNAIQSMVAVHREGEWRITLYQNTPAQFHGRPDLAEALTAELRALLTS